MNEILEYALHRLDEACRNGEACDIHYWSGYCDGVRACIVAVRRVDEIIAYALDRLENVCRNGEARDVQFWSGYCDGVRACMRAEAV